MISKGKVDNLEVLLKVVYNRIDDQEEVLDLYNYIREFNEKMVSERLDDIYEKENPILRHERRIAFKQVIELGRKILMEGNNEKREY